MIKCIQVENACINEDIQELDEFTIAEGEKIAAELDLDYVGVEIKGNVMVIAHDDGQFVYIRQD
jgi:hypothetical protein